MAGFLLFLFSAAAVLFFILALVIKDARKPYFIVVGICILGAIASFLFLLREFGENFVHGQ
jgi:uncharacterized membrane protein